MSNLSKAFLTEAKECYSIYGRRDGIPIAELGNALRSLGVNPTNTELQNIIADIGSPASVSYDMFMVSYTLVIMIKEAESCSLYEVTAFTGFV